MIVRPAGPADAALLSDIERSAAAAFAGVPGLEWIIDDDVMAVGTHGLLIAAGTEWVADDDGLVGFLAAGVEGSALHIHELAVVHAHQGRGIGRALVRSAMAWSHDRGLSAVTLTTFRDVPWNGPFYARLGFAEARDDERLAAHLAREVAAGLPVDRRCAMRLTL